MPRTRVNATGERPLEPRQQQFVDEYLKDLNASAAAIRCGSRPGSGAVSMAGRMMKEPLVRRAIDEALAARSARTRITTDWLLQRLAREADADINDIFDEHGDPKPIKDWPAPFRQGLITGFDLVREQIGEKPKDAPDAVRYIRKVRLADRTKLLELIGRHVNVQAWRDNSTVRHDFEHMTDEELARARTELVAKLMGPAKGSA